MKFIKILAVLFFAGFLSACGGGGSSTPPNTPEPTVWDNSTWDNTNWQ